MTKQHRNIEYKSVSMDTATYTRFKMLAGRKKLATYLRGLSIQLTGNQEVKGADSKKTLVSLMQKIEDLARQVDALWNADTTATRMENANAAALKAVLTPEQWQQYELHGRMNYKLGQVKYHEWLQQHCPHLVDSEPDWNAIDWDKAPSAAALFNMRNGNKGKKGA